MKNCLVTGATGFVGKRLVEKLIMDGLNVYGVSKNTNTPFIHENYKHIKCNLEKSEIPKVILNKIDTVFHLAGYAHDQKKSKTFIETHKSLTYMSSIKLAKKVKKIPIKNFIFVSTVKAGMNNEHDTNNNKFKNSIDKKNVYGFYKRKAEIELLKIFKNSNIHFSIIRPSLVYGPNLKGNLGNMFRAIKWRLFPPLPIIKNKKSMIHIDDLVEAILILVKNKKSKYKIYIASDGKVYSTYDIYKIFKTIQKQKIPSWNLPYSFFTFLKSNPYFKSKINKLIEDDFYYSGELNKLGFKPKLSLKKIYEKNF